MKIKYKTIKKIHLYACLSIVAILLMFIVTSYVMIYHDRFEHEATKQTNVFDYDTSIKSENHLEQWAGKHDVPGRKMNSYVNRAGNQVLEYQNAGTHTRLTFIDTTMQVRVESTEKSKADAFVGIHRNKGYGGGVAYNIYAFFLDILGVSLILFTITGVFMWVKLLKANVWAWIIFLGGLLYFSSVWLYLTFV